jgi:hypothetical protein
MNSFIRMPNGHYSVCCGNGTYDVNPDTGACSCPHYTYRLAGKAGVLCRHGEALKAHLEEERACPHCGGRGVFRSLLELECGSEPRKCSLCDGTGQRCDCDPDLLARLYPSLPGDAALRALFA